MTSTTRKSTGPSQSRRWACRLDHYSGPPLATSTAVALSSLWALSSHSLRQLALLWQIHMGGTWLLGSFKDSESALHQQWEWQLVCYLPSTCIGVNRAAAANNVVTDLFYDYERGQKLGLWVLALDSGLLLGPTCT